MSDLKKSYQDKVKPILKEKFGYKSEMEIPKLEKVIVTIGAGKALKDSKLLDMMIENLRRITGQQPAKTKAKTSISNFGIREGMTVGLKVTLRKDKMYDFVNRLVNLTLPRVRDFQGIEDKSFDSQGNYSLGFKEYTVFPEITGGEVEKVHGLEVTIKTTATTDKEAKALLTELGFPFKKK
ncbi:50S ribosomal protein L5 [Patescibacteria group bacterium]|nr:50S ribosomal protein L5 [Patescibacteria group bacterium]